jgi:environmental stress-induced protein Ves
MKGRVTHFAPTAYKLMPWKNGAGSTTELLIAPEGASVQSGFDWRISLAQVPVSGPFSSFPGYQRTIMLLQGDPMRLLHQAQGEHQLLPFQPYEFQGAWQTEGILSGRPVEDFNVMVRNAYGRARVDVQKASEQSVFALQDAPLHFIHCWQGAASVTMQNQKTTLCEKESLLIEDGVDIVIHAGSSSSIVIIVTFIPSSN